MLIITLRTDNPEAELGLYDNENQLTYISWLAHRQLAETIHQKIDELVRMQGKKLHEIQGIVVFRGPGSFTGLRIGITVANALADSLQASIVATTDPNWLEAGIEHIKNGKNDHIALPEYGALPNITAQKK